MQRLQIGRRLAANAGTATVPALRKGKSRAAQKRSEIIFLFLPPNVTMVVFMATRQRGLPTNFPNDRD